MKKQTISFIVYKKNGVVAQVGNSSILQPRGTCKERSIKWFDDSFLLKTNIGGEK